MVRDNLSEKWDGGQWVQGFKVVYMVQWCKGARKGGGGKEQRGFIRILYGGR